ncbi:hypothetical protein BST61_g10230 [Cercospora zeina]
MRTSRKSRSVAPRKKLRSIGYEVLFDDFLRAIRFWVGKEEAEFGIHTSVMLVKCDALYDNLACEDMLHQVSDPDKRPEAVLPACAVPTFRLFVTWLYTGHIVALPLGWLYKREVYTPFAADYRNIRGYCDEVDEILRPLSHTNTEAGASPIEGADGSKSEKARDTDPASDDEDDEAFVDGNPIRAHHAPMLVDQMMTLLAQKREEGWPLLCSNRDLIETIYGALPPSSAMCRFVIDEAVWCWSADKMDTDDVDSYPPEFNAAFIKAVLKHDKNIMALHNSWRSDLCTYHDHKLDLEQIPRREALGPWYESVDVKSREEYARRYIDLNEG